MICACWDVTYDLYAVELLNCLGIRRLLYIVNFLWSKLVARKGFDNHVSGKVYLLVKKNGRIYQGAQYQLLIAKARFSVKP